MLYEGILSGQRGINLEQIVVRMDNDPFDPAAMTQALRGLAACHAALRSVVDLSAAEGPQQRVLDQVHVSIAVLDWADQPDPAAALDDLLDRDRRAGVDPASAPPWRVQWIKLAGDASVLIWTFSHHMLDGRSFTILLEELFDRFHAALAEKPFVDPPHIVAFQNHCLAVAAFPAAASTAHFRALLSGFSAPTAVGFNNRAGLPFSANVPATRKPILSRHLDVALTDRLTQRAARVGVTVATMISAAWGMVLARVAGQSEAVFGVTRAGRSLVPDADRMIGCLITTVPMIVRMTPDHSLDDLLRQVRSDQLALRPHEHCPLSVVKSVTDVPQDRPLFNSLVMFERASLGARMAALGGAWAQRHVEVFEEGALPLTLAAYGDAALLLRLEHDEAVVDSHGAARYLDYLCRLLQAMADAPGTARLCDLHMLGPDEAAEILALGQPDSPVAPPAICLVDQIAQRAATHPDAIGLHHIAGGHMTYGAMDRRANQLAHHLRGLGLGQGDIIGLSLPRGLDYVVALLAVMKTGAAFLPMDPTYPLDALAHMAQDSGAALILTAPDASVWRLRQPHLAITATLAADAPTTPPEPFVLTADALAYVIYTSGTTGRPKGVMVSHRSLAAHAAAAIQAYGLTAEDRVLQFASLSFDVAIEEILPTLAAGATLVLRTDTMIAAPHAMMDSVRQAGVTVLNLPTGYWQVLGDAADTGALRLPPAVRLVIAGGERVPAAALLRWQARMPGARWMNGYGPTEATITSACYAPSVTFTGQDVPIGRPMGHARLYLRSPDGSLAPRGAIAELWIGGDCVALGYLGQPALTTERFAPDPYLPGGRVYRSGDLAHWGGERQLHMIGRADRQIKMRGFRIEPGEVERVLEGLPDVGQALVAVVDAATPAARLVGWLRPAVAGVTLDTTRLSEALTQVLPPHMRPILVSVADWPQTPGGKIDTSRLPRPGQADALTDHLGDAYQGDATTMQVVQIMADLLGKTRVGVDQSFFDLGGHSLLMVRLIGRIEASFGQRLGVAQITSAPTARGIASLLSSAVQGNALADCLVAIQPHGSRPPIYGVHVLGINGSYYRPLAATLGPDQPVFGLTVGLLTAQTPTGVSETAEMYFKVIAAHQPTGPLSLVAVSLGSYVALDLAQRLLAAGRDVTMLAILDAEGPGGRARITGPTRLRAHWGKLRAEGAGYLLHTLQHKTDDIRHWYEKLRLVLSGQMGRPHSPTTTVEGFVAANELAVQAYRAKPYPRRLTVIRADGNVFDSPATIQSGLGWAEVAAGGFDVIEVAGDHLSIMDTPWVTALAATLVDVIERQSADQKTGKP